MDRKKCLPLKNRWWSNKETKEVLMETQTNTDKYLICAIYNRPPNRKKPTRSLSDWRELVHHSQFRINRHPNSCWFDADRDLSEWFLWFFFLRNKNIRMTNVLFLRILKKEICVYINGVSLLLDKNGTNVYRIKRKKLCDFNCILNFLCNQL